MSKCTHPEVMPRNGLPYHHAGYTRECVRCGAKIRTNRAINPKPRYLTWEQGNALRKEIGSKLYREPWNF